MMALVFRDRVLCFKVENLEEDFKDGVRLINLVEVLTGCSLGHYDASPAGRIQRCPPSGAQAPGCLQSLPSALDDAIAA